MLKKHETLCSNMFIKSILKNGKMVFTYDWAEILERYKTIKIIDISLSKHHEF